jgi:hypothetical protein
MQLVHSVYEEIESYETGIIILLLQQYRIDGRGNGDQSPF